jgi:hypothetical protein
MGIITQKNGGAMIHGKLQGGRTKRDTPNRSGKIQRPGPDTPTGKVKTVRVARACEQCGVEFWPRVVDVRAGKGKHCSSNCSSKAYRKPKTYKAKCARCGREMVGANDAGRPPKYCAAECRKAAGRDAGRAARKRCAEAGCAEPRANSGRYCEGHWKGARPSIEIAGERFLISEVARASGIDRNLIAERVRRHGHDTAMLFSRRQPGQPRSPQPHALQITHNGRTDTRKGWARLLGVSDTAIVRFMRDGRSFAEAFEHYSGRKRAS